MVREAPGENLYDFIRQISQLKSVYEFLSDEGRGTTLTNKEVSLA